MKTFVKKIEEKDMKEIANLYYKEQALNGLVKNSTQNKEASAVILESYSTAFANWQSAMDKNEHAVLGELYQNFTYEYNMKFATNEMVLTTSDEKVIAKLEKAGFKEV